MIPTCTCTCPQPVQSRRHIHADSIIKDTREHLYSNKGNKDLKIVADVEVRMLRNDIHVAYLGFCLARSYILSCNIDEVVSARALLFRIFKLEDMPVLGYWSIRGLAQPIRFLLQYLGQDYEEKRYDFGTAPDYSRESWLKEKFTLGLDFPNLPYYIDGDVKITQSNAILRYIGTKNKMNGSTDQEQAAVDMLENQLHDFSMTFFMLVWNPKFETAKADYISTALPGHLKLLSSYLASKKWLVGENLTFPDFRAYEYLWHVTALAPNCLDEFQNLKDYKDRFEALKPIADYMKSDKYLKWPITVSQAQWGW